MPAPRFSIIITSYNQREFINDAVTSALGLPRANREIIVVDDASTDGSQDVLLGYGDAIRLISLDANRGRGGARNAGASLAIGEYLVFLDGDDAFLPWALAVYDRVVQTEAPKLILSPMSWFRGPLPAVQAAVAPAEIRIVEYADYLHKDRSFGVSASSVVFDRLSFQAVQGWAEDLVVLQDQDLVLRLAVSGRAMHVLSPPTTFHRAHPGQVIHQVRQCIVDLGDMLRKEREGLYPGGERRRDERRAILGALVFFWGKRAAKAGLILEAVMLLARNALMVCAAIVRRFRVVLNGRRASRVIGL
jgi:glycosyltransferase involved in cell wall biosynthesis